MKLLVLGGAGYIGSHTATGLIDSGHEVLVADSLVTGYKTADLVKNAFDKLGIKYRDKLALTGERGSCSEKAKDQTSVL